MTQPPFDHSPDEPTPPPPPPPTPSAGGEPQGATSSGPPAVDFSILLRGNWTGAATAAVVAFGVAGVLSLLTAFLGAEDLDFKSALGMTALLTGATFGADFIGVDDQHVGQFPLLITFLALAAAVVVFRRATAGTHSYSAALGDAVRAGLILSVLTTVLAIVVKIVEPDLRGYDLDEASADNGVAWSYVLIQLVSGKTTTSIAGAIFLPFLILTAVLAIACFLRRDWLRDRFEQAHDWLAAPIAGLAALTMGLFAAGAVYILAILIHVEDARSLSGFVGMLVLLPSLGLRMLGLGSGAPFGSKSESGSEDEEEMERLSGFADQIGGLFWVAPIVAIAIALFAVWTVIRRSPDRTKSMRDVAVYLGLLIVAIPVLARFANFTGGGESGDDDVSFWFGIDKLQTMFFFLLISAAAGALLLVLTGNLDVAAVKGKAASLQTKATESPQQWGQQQPEPPATGDTSPPPPPPPPPNQP